MPYLIILTAAIGLGDPYRSVAVLSGVGRANPGPGLMLRGGAEAYAESAPWVAIFPGLVITLTVFDFNLFGNSVRDALEQNLRSL